MSESIVRKIQPFTIGTKLSVPAVPKCPDFSESYLPSRTLDNRTLRHNLNDQVSLYLGRTQARPYDRHLVMPVASQAASSQSTRDEMAEEDHLNRNAASPTAASRSIRKIAISSTPDPTRDTRTRGSDEPLALKTSPSTENVNNNNNISTSDPPPPTAGVNCGHMPSSHLKVLLRKDTGDEKKSKNQQSSGLLPHRGKSVSSPQMPVLKACSPKRDLLKGDSPTHEHKEVSTGSKVTDVTQNGPCFTQQNALFNQEISQAEAWIKGKLQDLRDGWSSQRCPLKDWEEESQTLQWDLKDFENTLIQLNQLGEQLMSKLNPTAELVRKQLTQLRDQWQTLKQTAANQSKALGGARNLQEFNRKVDRLEAWIKEKEEEQSLAHLLGANADKMQLTRRVLDLKQDEQLYRNLLEEINQLALKLEKLGRAEGKNISTRRKHVNKMWLKVQSLLKDYHEHLQVALEIASFYQQADNIVGSINSMRKNLLGNHGHENSGDGEIRDIASQIMMQDVTVSQLSNLHPALVARVMQKQTEVKDCWALLQKAIRNEKAAGPPPSSQCTREDVNPSTSSREPQCSVGMMPPKLLGKEVKEEQNRLRGFVEGREPGNGRKPISGAQEGKQPIGGVREEKQPITGESPACTRTADVAAKHPPQAESGKQRAGPKPGAATMGHPQLHTQLQKFTVSADKTLSWLKDSVAMATGVDCEGGGASLEAARRCQAALQQDILSNRARIELVKKEGRSLVRAQHPGSAKIEGFLSQLEVLWEELKRQHQRNTSNLQHSEDLNYRAVRALQGLASLEAWLQAVELSIGRASLAGDPKAMSAAERESSLLEREVAGRALELQDLRREVEVLAGQQHLHAKLLPTRLGEVDKKYSCVQNALRQQSSDLRDTRMLTEFLERVELEESHYCAVGQPLCSDTGPEQPLLTLQSGASSGEPLMDSIGDPVEELREAVEMLNDTARARGRSLSHDQSIHELISQNAVVSGRVGKGQRRCAELAVDVLEMEREMAVKCEPERSGLDALEHQHRQMEIDYQALRTEVEALDRQASRLAELCPERMHVLGAEVQATLQAWLELGKGVEENRDRLLQFGRLRHFFRNYLAMISWTEDTRLCIFSESALLQRKVNQEPLAEVLDQQIETKFEEFDELAAAGKELIDGEHHLTKMIKERMEELRSMLGWILVHWRNQRDQWINRKKTVEPQADAIYSEATLCMAAPGETSRSVKGVGPGDMQRTADSPVTAPSGGMEDSEELEDGYEVMGRLSPKGRHNSSSASQAPSSPYLVMTEPSAPSLGGTVNLILSFGNAGDSPLQVQEPEREEETMVETPEGVHRPAEPPSARKSFWRRCQGLFGSLKRKKKIYRHSAEEVSTYLHVKDTTTVLPLYESITLPRLKTQSPTSCSTSSLCPASSQQVNTASLHTVPRGSTGSIFSSLKRKNKKRKKKRDARRHTIQKIMGEEESEEASAPSEHEPVMYDTHTWPLKERRKRKNMDKSGTRGTEIQEYIRNPLVMDIDEECSGGLCSRAPSWLSEGPSAQPSPPSRQVRSHCRFLSLGSVLSFDLPKDMSLIPSIQDVITIGPSEPRRTDNQQQDPSSDRPAALSTFKLARSPPAHQIREPKLSPHTDVTLKIERPGTQIIHMDAISVSEETFPPPPPPVTEDFDTESNLSASLNELTDVHLKHPSRISGLHEEAEQKQDKMTVKLFSHEKPSVDTPREQESSSSTTHCSASAEVIHICPSVHTLIQDLNGHQYQRQSKPASGRQGQLSPLVPQSHSSQVVLNFKTSGREDSVDSGHSSSGSFKLCAEAPVLDTPENPTPRRMVGKFLSLETERASPNHSECPKLKKAATPDPVHPDHQQFEQEEAELEDIWNQTNGYRQSVCSDIMYQGYQGYQTELASSPPGQAREPSPKEQAVLYRKLVTASAPNLLIAEFRLPPHIQSLLGYGKEPDTGGEVRTLGKGERRSWAAFPIHQQPNKQASLVNETASDMVKLPEIEDQQKYIYQYREEAEEEEEENKGGLKDQSMSLLSVHMGLDGNVHDTEVQEQWTTSRGHSNSLSERPDFPSMEGTLERKHKLQMGGKKASCRTWNSYHTILYRQTLCFYQNRKDTLGSSVTSLPLNLVGAECTSVPENTKKPNCFSLRLCDGSEYLLSASSRFMMKKWMLKIQANTGSSGSMPVVTMPQQSPAQALSFSINSSSCSTCHCQSKCRCPNRDDVTSSLSGHSHTGTARAKETVVLSRDSAQNPLWQHHGRLENHAPALAPDVGHCDTSRKFHVDVLREQEWTQSSGLSSVSPCSSLSPSLSQDWTMIKHRSHSFTSATYQRIKPVTLPPAGRGQDCSSSYSVTLFIGDGEKPSVCQSTMMPRLAVPSLDTFTAKPLRSYASLPRPRNKSVFKKFFGKKE